MDTFGNAPAGTLPPEPASLRCDQVEAVPLLTCSPSTATLSVADVISLYLEHVTLRNQLGTFSTGSVVRVSRLLKNFSKHFGALGMDQCRSDQLTKWLLANPGWKSDSTKADAITTVMVAFRWAADERYIPYIPYRRPKGLTIRPRPRPPISPEEFKLFMLEARNRKGRHRRPSSCALRKACCFLWRTGARTCEMRLLLKSEINWDLGTARLRHHKTERFGDDRVIGLDDRTLRLLRLQIRTTPWDPRPCACELATEKREPHRVDDHVFFNGRGSVWTSTAFGMTFRKFARQAGIDPKKTAYCLRHGFCVRAIRPIFHACS